MTNVPIDALDALIAEIGVVACETILTVDDRDYLDPVPWQQAVRPLLERYLMTGPHAAIADRAARFEEEIVQGGMTIQDIDALPYLALITLAAGQLAEAMLNDDLDGMIDQMVKIGAVAVTGLRHHTSRKG